MTRAAAAVASSCSPTKPATPSPSPSPSPRVVAFGVDTLYLHWRVPLATSLVRRLSQLREEAAALPLSKGGGVPIVELSGHRFEVQGHASRTAPLFLHEEGVMDLHVSPTPPIAAMPTVAMELRSVWLWQRGAHAAVADACAVLDELLPDGVELPPAQLAPQVSRVDVCCDFQWGDTLKCKPALLYPARLSGDDDPNAPGLRCRAAKFDSHYDGRESTGASYGRKTSEVSAGIYNKSAEIRDSSLKTWFEDVWKKSPEYVATEEVWRLEFRLKRDGLRSLHCPGVRRELLTWADVAEHLEAVWRYLSGEWLVWRGQRTAEKRNTIDPRWAPLHEVNVGAFHEGCATVLRRRLDKVGEAAVAQLCGYFSQCKAHVEVDLGRELTLDAALPLLVEQAVQHGERSGRSVEARCAEKRERITRLLAVAASPPPPPLPPRMPAGLGARMAANAATVAARRAERRRRFVEGQRRSWRGAK